MRPAFALGVLAGLAAVQPARAATVFINDPGVTVTSISNLVMGAKYRVSPTNFDLSLDSGGGTQNVPGGANFISTNLGNLAALNNVSFDFTLRNIVGQGMIFSVTSPANVTSTLAWGSFAPALSPAATASAAQLRAASATGETPGTLLSPGQLAMNALHLEVSSRVRPLAAPNNYAPVVSLSNLAFSATGAAVRGSVITAQTVTPATNLTNPNFPEVGSGFASQWLVTTGDFWDFGWVLSGRINAQVNSITGNIGQIDEWVKFGVSGKQVAFTGGVPEPQSWAMMIAGFGLVGAAMRRRRALPA
ncbi:hypothetical protein CAP39_03330 [Sphingomonas sp. IBVSS1]|nr:hypothetical protein CAP39_03330 [Sphingomonas sp. IBVSS1]